MLSMDFLTRRVDGLELINFQNDDFHVKLSNKLKENINEQSMLSVKCADEITAVIKEFTNFSNVKIEFHDGGNLSVDVGYFSPNHIFNSANVDVLLKNTETTLYKWFVASKDKVFKGSVDYRTGKVHGAFTTLPITIKIGTDLSATFASDKIQKYGVPIHELLATGIVHEVGHCYGGCALMATTAMDNFTAKAGLTFFRSRKLDDERVAVLQDMSALLQESPESINDLKEIASKNSDESLIMYFNKLVSRRNTSRALSLGVTNMSSEVVADLYAIRMGCGKATVAAIGTMVDQGIITISLNSLMAGILCMVFTTIAFTPTIAGLLVLGFGVYGILMCMLITFVLSSILSYFYVGYADVYNAGHRRFEDAIRQMIAKLKEVKDIPPKEKTQLLNDIEKFLAINETLKPWYENNVVRRFFGVMFSGNDFKKTETEHFTQALLNSELNVLSARLKTLV